MAEIPFEVLAAAIEANRGTAIAAPTHLLHTGGMLTPTKSVYRPPENRGTLAANYRSVVTRRGASFELQENAVDVGILPFLLNGVVEGNVTSPSTPPSASLTRLWEFVRNITGDDIESYTVWWGDPNVEQWISAFAMIDEFSLNADANAEDGVLMFSATGMARPAADNSPVDTAPLATAAALLPAQLMQLWLDTGGDAIGTTPVTGRVLSASHTIRTGVTYKYFGSGPAHTLGFSSVGRNKVAACTTTITFEMPDDTEYDLWVDHTVCKTRMRYNGALIESVAGPIDYYNYVEVDTYGPLVDLAWGENAESNRTLTVTIESEYDADLGSDLRIAVQNTRTGL